LLSDLFYKSKPQVRRGVWFASYSGLKPGENNFDAMFTLIKYAKISSDTEIQFWKILEKAQ